MAAKKETTKSAVAESTGFAEIGSYMYRNNGTGKVSVKMHTSVNKPLSLDDADEVLRIKKIRVETRVVEDKGLADGVAYQKDVEAIQTTDSETPSSTSSRSSANESPPSPGDGNPTGLQVLKNFVDNIAADLRDHKNLATILFVVIGAVAVAALILAIV